MDEFPTYIRIPIAFLNYMLTTKQRFNFYSGSVNPCELDTLNLYPYSEASWSEVITRYRQIVGSIILHDVLIPRTSQIILPQISFYLQLYNVIKIELYFVLYKVCIIFLLLTLYSRHGHKRQCIILGLKLNGFVLDSPVNNGSILCSSLRLKI